MALLGEVSTRRDGCLVPLPGARARSLLVALAARPGRSRSAQALIDEVWADQPPRAPMNALHTQVSRLRAALPDGAVEMGPAGYRLALSKAQVDITLARQLEQRAQQCHAEGDHRGAVESVGVARALWRGEPGADLPDGQLASDLGIEAAARLAALDAVEIAARVAMGDLSGALTGAKERAERHPLDEAAHAELMHILVGLGRDSDALDVFAALKSQLADQLGADPNAALVDLNTAILRGEVSTPPTASPQSRQPQRTELPTSIGLRAAPNALLGRADDIAAIEALLQTSRVTTVLGPGGTGKTRVVNEIGSRAAAELPVVLVELASVRSGDDVIGAISGTLGVSEVVIEPGALTRTRLDSARARLRQAVSVRKLLLILDNCEHVIDDVSDIVAELVSATAQLTVLATSRAPMMLTAETVYPLPPLTIDAAGSPATELFSARAKAVRPAVRLDADEVARLCSTLDGLPLAIELAAARTRTMTVEQINTRLRHRFELLRSSDRTSPERHRTLHAVIEWSWNLLDFAQQAALRRLCRFPGGFTIAAAEKVAERGDSGTSGVTDIAEALDGLVNQSMLTVIEDDGPSGLRYQMLETVREFGEEQLAAAGEADATEHRMALWACDIAVQMLDGARFGRQVATANLMAAEHENLLAVLRSAISRRDGLVVYTVFAVLGMGWAVRGSHSEIFAWGPRILDIDARPVDREIPADLLVMSYLLAGLHMFISGDIRPIALARLRVRSVLKAGRNLDPAVRLYASLVVSPVSGKGTARMLAEAAHSDDEWSRSAALGIRANIRENNGDIYGSLRDGTEALELATERGDVYLESMVCQHLGSLAGQSARYEDSVDYYRQAIDALLQLQAFDESVQVRGFLGASLVGAGRPEECRRELEDLFTDPGAGGTGTPGPSDEAKQRYAAMTASLAEADLAEGNIDAGLKRYDAALAHAGWPHAGPAPGPYDTLLACAVICANVLHGRAGEIDAIVAQTITLATARLGRFLDLPQIGGAAAAVGSYAIASGRDPAVGMRLLALADPAKARQDYPSMALARHHEAARSVLGDEVVDAELNRAAGVKRAVAAREIMALIARI
ncbi:BTAD domain-containing putative transcriptional regulator [Antrihabitans stalagmiti]|uniref:BTAD domain-containing putative transcriptional regulator n=1 Tax=Antrihabitans stalagmiti TaxID=2799499 RepID=UPI0027DAE79E|nr:BTAD domain-containing putative transcriptional regulator [Antrihabitans stalagmiti]